jgi:hypothetical protein
MYLSAFNIFLLWLSPLAVSVLTFTACVFVGTPLTVARVFTAIATFRILQEPLRSFPTVSVTDGSTQRLRSDFWDERRAGVAESARVSFVLLAQSRHFKSKYGLSQLTLLLEVV